MTFLCVDIRDIYWPSAALLLKYRQWPLKNCINHYFSVYIVICTSYLFSVMEMCQLQAAVIYKREGREDKLVLN